MSSLFHNIRDEDLSIYFFMYLLWLLSAVGVILMGILILN